MEFWFMKRLILKGFLKCFSYDNAIHLVLLWLFVLLILKRIYLDLKKIIKLFWILKTIFNCNWCLLYLAQCTRHGIVFPVNLLARYSSFPTWRHWNSIKHILRYLCRNINLGLFYLKFDNHSGLIGYANVGYLSDPCKKHF